ILFGMEQLVATPHLGASTSEAQENVALQVAEQMSDYLVDGAVTNALNMPSITAEEAPRLKPYMTLAEQLGGFMGQVIDSGIKAVTVEYEGDATQLNTRPIHAVILQSLLAPVLDESVNMVNAPVVAKERDIDCRDVKLNREGNYHTLIRLTVDTENRSRVIEGTLFADRQPRIVKVMGIDIEAQLGRTMLYVTNDDKPGFIGALGSILGDANINIANFNLGRSVQADGGALALIDVDEDVPQDVLAKICDLSYVRQAKVLRF
ncbi:MAG: ACT domain-containing protein, partial [Alphaproteobacteria bacterium]|nr:ACT domain-containing protein [Alphaproteobacteria bacterium]